MNAPRLDVDNPDDRLALGILHEIASWAPQPLAAYKPGNPMGYGTAAHERLLGLGYLEWTGEDHGAWQAVQVTEEGWLAVAAYAKPVFEFKSFTIPLGPIIRL